MDCMRAGCTYRPGVAYSEHRKINPLLIEFDLLKPQARSYYADLVSQTLATVLTAGFVIDKVTPVAHECRCGRLSNVLPITEGSGRWQS